MPKSVTVEPDGVTIEYDSVGKLRVKNGGISLEKLAVEVLTFIMTRR